AEGWTWSGSIEAVRVGASADAWVSLVAPDGVVSALEQTACTCLLWPRCLHLAAVLLRLELDETPVVEHPETSVVVEGGPLDLVDLSAGQHAAADQAWHAAAALLD